MSQNSTNIPGIDPNDPYSRKAPSSDKGTVVPGMQNQAPGVETPINERKSAPVVGFLYSISRKGVGEYWPVSVGQNSIGRDASNDIVLAEATVSGRHALLNVKQLKQSHKLVAQIRDEGSKNGIMVNDEELDFGIYECHNGDLIRIGDNYLLLLILIDAHDRGLKVSDEFISTDEMPAPPAFAPMGPGMGDSTVNPYDSRNRAYNGTQAMDGRNDFESGGTKFL